VYINPASEDLFQISSRRATGTQLNKVMYIDGTFQARLSTKPAFSYPVGEK